AVLALRPAVTVAVRGERVRPRLLQRLAGALGNLGAESVGAVIVERVFEPRVLAVGAIAPVALDGADRFSDGEQILRSAKAEHVADTRIGFRLAVGHAHAAADRNVPALDDILLADDGDKAEVLREHVDVVRRRNGEADLELPRHVGLAIDRLDVVALALARDLLAVEEYLVI